MTRDDIIRVELNMHDLALYRSEAEAQFAVRMKLKQAGIPIGAWDTSTVQRGILSWRDDERGIRIVEWHDAR